MSFIVSEDEQDGKCYDCLISTALISSSPEYRIKAMFAYRYVQ